MSHDAMQVSNTTKAKSGNDFQNKFYQKACLLLGDSAQVRNNNYYQILVRAEEDKTESDVEVVFKHDKKTKFIFECTTTIRNDRYRSKDAQAEGIINYLKGQGIKCCYCLVMPDDEYYVGKNADKERHFNEVFADKINNKKNITSDNCSFLQLMLRESEALAFIEEMQTFDNFDVTYIVNEWRQRLRDAVAAKKQVDLPEIEQLSFFD